MTIDTGTARAHLENYKAPDGGWGWVIVFVSFLIHFIMDGIIYSLGIYLPAFVREFNVSHGEASLVHSLLPAITLSTGPLASWFTNAYGCRLTTIIGAVIASIGFFLSYFVTKFYLLYITIGCIVGIGFGLVYVPAIVSVGYYFEKKRSLAIGIAVCGAGVGTFILSPINRILENSFGIHGAFMVKSLMTMSMLICGLFIRPVPVEPSEIKKAMRAKKKSTANATATQATINTKMHHESHPVPIRDIENKMTTATESVNNNTNKPTIEQVETDNISEDKSRVIAIMITDPLSIPKTPKIGDSLPEISIRNEQQKNSSSLKVTSNSTTKRQSPPKNQQNITLGGGGSNTDTANTNNYLQIESSGNELTRSMPMLTMDRSARGSVNKSKDTEPLRPSSKVQSINSALDIMAHVRSLQSIPICNLNQSEGYSDDDDDDDFEDDSGGKCIVIEEAEAAAAAAASESAALAQRDKRRGSIRAHSRGGDSRGVGWFSNTRAKFNRLLKQVDLSLFRSPVFLLFTASNFLTSLGFNTPFIYVVDQATLLGIDSTRADLLLSTIGISNTIGRVILGFISDMKRINRVYLYATLLTLCGIATAIEPFLTDFYGLFVYSIIFGLTSGGYVSLTSVLLVDLLGLEKLTNAFGILLVFQGVATLFGPPSVGILYDIFHSYVIPFVIMGVLIAMSGILCYFLPCLKRKYTTD